MFKTLKVRLYTLTLMIIIPCCIFIFISFDNNRTIIKKELLKTADLVSEQAATTHQNLITSTQNFLAALVLVPELQNPDSDVCRAFVTKMTSLMDRYINIGVPNSNGILTCNGTALKHPINVQDRPYIRNAIMNNEFTSSGVLLDRVIGNPTINFAYPVRQQSNNENVIGAAVAVISLQWWNMLLMGSNLPKNSIAFVLDNQNNPVASFPENRQYERPHNLEAVWKGNDGISRVFNQHHVYNAENEILLTFLTGVAIDKSLTSINDRYTDIILSFLVMVIIVLALSHSFFINTISRPLKALSNLALRLGENEKISTYNPTYVKEMDNLQKSFIQMAKLKSQAEQKSILQAKTDNLTNIPNRDSFTETLASEIMIAEKNRTNLGVILLDLDNFKEINDVHGHEVGDKMLKHMAAQLIQQCPYASYMGRFGGDEFIFLFNIKDVTFPYLQRVADNIRNLVKQPYIVASGTVYLSASLGISMYPNDGKNVKELISAVDQAMHHAKACGRDVVRRFNWDLKHNLLEKTQLTHDLRKGIINQEFYLVYQPIIDKYGKVAKFEALIRWNHPVRGVIPPDHFIALAEESGQIIEIGKWVIKEAKQALSRIREVFSDIQMSVNISPLQLSKQEGDELSTLLKVTGGSKHNCIVLEITENLLMNLDANTRKSLLDFKDKNIQVALDDFGTGYSSLSYIMDYDIDYLKIDKMFVQKIHSDFSSVSLCEAIISMAHQLNILVIAEGVETKKQMEILSEYGCDYLQGYYFSKPLPLEKVLTYQQDKLLPSL